MSSALQIAHTDLTGAQKVTATNAVRPAKRPLEDLSQSAAMKLAEAKIREWEKFSGKKVTDSHRDKLISWAFEKLNMARPALSSIYITPEEAQFIGSDCLMKMREAA